MARAAALILTGFGINCDYETQFAFRLAGADADRVHLNDLISDKNMLDRYNILAIPGGFSFGDDIASGKVLANRMRYVLGAELSRFVRDGKLVISFINLLNHLGGVAQFAQIFSKPQCQAKALGATSLQFKGTGGKKESDIVILHQRRIECRILGGEFFVQAPGPLPTVVKKYDVINGCGRRTGTGSNTIHLKTGQPNLVGFVHIRFIEIGFTAGRLAVFLAAVFLILF